MPLVGPLLCLVALLLGGADAGNVLVVVPMPSHSHQVVFRPLWEALSRRGHNVTVVTADPRRDPRLVNLTEIDVGPGNYELVEEVYRSLNGLSPSKITDLFQDYMLRLSVNTLEHPQVFDMIANKSRYHFDVVLVESLFYELLAFGRHFDAPTVLLSSFDAQTNVHAAVGNPRHPIAHPDYVLPFHGGEQTFAERVVAVLVHLYVNYVRVVRWYPPRRREMARFFGEGVPAVPELLDSVSLTFLNVNPAIDGATPLAPSTIAFGDGVHIAPPRELPEDVGRFLDGSGEGFVYFSLGGNILWNTDELRSKLRALLEVFDALPYRVLAKYDVEQLGWTSENVMTIKWAPQQDVLRHPKIKCFVTQAGHQSMEEAIYSHVPMVVLPMFGDQYQNAKRIQDHGLGKAVRHIPDVDKRELLDAILEVARNETYKRNAARLARLALDQPMTGVEKVTWWTEYLIRNGDASHLRNRAVELPWHQYLLLDVAAFLLLALGLVAAALAWTATRIYRLLRPGKGPNKKKRD